MSETPSLSGKVAVVTGASRGIGKGIASILCGQGATVYITGRSLDTVTETAEAISSPNCTAVAVQCDHGKDEQVKSLFERVKAEQGKLDILVNNATILGGNPFAPPPFWTKSIEIAEQFTVGLRSAFIASYYAGPLLVSTGQALVVNVSYYGAVSYHLDPAYGATKAGLDKLTFDMAQDFKPYSVAVVSLWPGPTATERAKELISKLPQGDKMLESAETPEFAGLAVASLYADPNIMSKSGKVVIAAEAALEYDYRDVNGKQPPSLRALKGSPCEFVAKA